MRNTNKTYHRFIQGGSQEPGWSSGQLPLLLRNKTLSKWHFLLTPWLAMTFLKGRGTNLGPPPLSWMSPHRVLRNRRCPPAWFLLLSFSFVADFSFHAKPKAPRTPAPSSCSLTNSPSVGWHLLQTLSNRMICCSSGRLPRKPPWLKHNFSPFTFHRGRKQNKPTSTDTFPFIVTSSSSVHWGPLWTITWIRSNFLPLLPRFNYWPLHRGAKREH